MLFGTETDQVEENIRDNKNKDLLDEYFEFYEGFGRDNEYKD